MDKSSSLFEEENIPPQFTMNLDSGTLWYETPTFHDPVDFFLTKSNLSNTLFSYSVSVLYVKWFENATCCCPQSLTALFSFASDVGLF